ncbi:hypothetical protein F383_20712 [Gossypium arboreum]|uniref:Uncharacterized protein n=1 Tax=Gossypium arboreum TaxID=29729 RepID=A0A0B0MN37_GOSAR|nr:hypothetical protein F383_20712 [Gossypium arboreum]
MAVYMTVYHTRLRHTPVSLPVWTKIGYLPSHFATKFAHT